MVKITLGEIQQRVGGRISGDSGRSISAVSSLELAGEEAITFAENEGYLEAALNSHAGVIIVPDDFPLLEGITTLYVKNPRETFIGIMMMFDDSEAEITGIHPSATISEQGVVLASDVVIGEHVVVRDNVVIGQGSFIDSGVHIGSGVMIGEASYIGPNVVLKAKAQIGDRVRIDAGTVIGGEGFGYFWSGEAHQKVPQLGSVKIDNDVEIGSNVCIDRATFGETRIRAGVKIDNLVQIAHNNDIGEHSILVAQVGLSGTVTLGKRVTLAGHVGVADHTKIGDGVTVAARSGIMRDVEPGAVVLGAPARPVREEIRIQACIPRLPKLISQVRGLIKRIDKLEGMVDPEKTDN